MPERNSPEDNLGTADSKEGIPVHFYPLGGGHLIVATQLPIEVRNAIPFEALWSLRAANSATYRESRPGVPIYRQAYGVSQRCQKKRPKQPPIPTCLRSLVDWCRAFSKIDFNSVAVEWQEVSGINEPHWVNACLMVPASPSIVASFGAPAMVNIWPRRGQPDCRILDLHLDHGEMLIMPLHTNTEFAHKIESIDPFVGRRITVTVMHY